MRYTKNKFSFLIFLFIVFSINGGAIPLKHHLKRASANIAVFSAPSHDQEKSKLTQLEGVLYGSFRLTENTRNCFQHCENENLLLRQSFREPWLFSKQYFSHYTNDRLKQPSQTPIYIRCRNLII